MINPSILLPEQRSTLAPGVDELYIFLYWLSVVMFVLIVGAAFYFTYKYKRKPGDEKKLSTPTFHSMALELFWSVGPLLVCIGIFHWGVKSYMAGRVAPGNSYEIKVRAKKWSWEFEYPNGKIADKEFHVPVGRPIKLIMTSQDVIHSFFVPNYRVKQDAVPGRYSMVWFEVTSPGRDQVFCTEYCGNDHSNMLATVVAEPQADFDKWVDYDPDKEKPLLEVGKGLYEAKACNTCHSLDGSNKIGPTFKGLWGRKETLVDGSQVDVDENYLRVSILNPGAQIVKGYSNIMPSFQGSLKERQIQGLIEFIKAQK